MIPKSGWLPDIVLGIDFGMTCTGVAFSWGPEWPRPETIRHWPGNMIHELANKVPTKLTYRADGGGTPEKWGFQIKPDDQGLFEELFKLHLDPRYANVITNGPSVQQARQWFRDYMRLLHDHIATTLANTTPRWREQKVEFLFSIPTTWKDASMVVKIEEIIRQAGFGLDGPQHIVEVYLSEAEAAAVYASKQHYQRGDVLLVVDAGGGTTDVNLLRIENNLGEPSRISQLGFVEGQAIGSTRINFGFQKLIAARLEYIRHMLPEEPMVVAEKMRHDPGFEGFKCAFDGVSSDPAKRLPIPGLAPGLNRPDLSIEDSQMILRREEMQQFFDMQIERIFKLIDHEISVLETKYPNEKLSWIVMSGGFGSSPYIRSKLQQRYDNPAYSQRPALSNMKVNLISEPQLAVVHGLVLSRTQHITYQREVFKQKCCRASYGVLIQEPYDPARHVGEELRYDEVKKQTWAINQIDWLIKQGEPVQGDSVKKKYQLSLKKGQETASWKAQIVKCDSPAGALPQSLKTGEAEILCRVDTQLASSDMKLKNRHWYSFGPQYYRAEFFVNVILGVINLNFQLLSRDGVTCSRDHDQIAVEWGPPPMSGPGAIPSDQYMYREQ